MSARGRPEDFLESFVFFIDSLVVFVDDAIVAERLKEEEKWVFVWERWRMEEIILEEVQNEEKVGKNIDNTYL